MQTLLITACAANCCIVTLPVPLQVTSIPQTDCLSTNRQHIGERRGQLSHLQSETCHLARQQLPNLIHDVATLEISTILHGDYSLKMARQDYFTSKQDTVLYLGRNVNNNRKLVFCTKAFKFEPHGAQFQDDGKCTNDATHSISYQIRLQINVCFNAHVKVCGIALSTLGIKLTLLTNYT